VCRKFPRVEDLIKKVGWFFDYRRLLSSAANLEKVGCFFGLCCRGGGSSLKKWYDLLVKWKTAATGSQL